MPVELYNVISLVLQVLSLLIIGRALLSWFDPGMRSQPARLLVTLTEPVIGPIRQIMPNLGMIDISPIIALILLQVIQQILSRAVA